MAQHFLLSPQARDLTIQAHVIAPRSDDFSELHQEHPGGLVLDTELPGELEGGLALDRVGRKPDCQEHLLERQLAPGEGGAGT